MSRSAKSHLARYRARKASEGVVRVEVSVRKEDAGLVRDVAAALSDPARRAPARNFLRQRFAAQPQQSLKALLAGAPLAGIDLKRAGDFGRDIDL